MRTRPYLTAIDARDETEPFGLGVPIASGDEDGVLLALVRLNGAWLHTPEAATLKARIAAIVRTATADLQALLWRSPPPLSFPVVCRSWAAYRGSTKVALWAAWALRAASRARTSLSVPRSSARWRP